MFDFSSILGAVGGGGGGGATGALGSMDFSSMLNVELPDLAQSAPNLMASASKAGSGAASGAMGEAAKGAGLDKIMGGAGAVMDFAASFAPIAKDLSIGTQERMDDTGAVTYETDVLGQTLGTTMAGAKAGNQIVPGIGGVVGGAVGLIGGGIASLIGANKNPDQNDILNRHKHFDMTNMVKTIRSNDTMPQQAQAAKHGMNNVANNKMIEVEKDEIVLRKTGKSFKKVADFKGGKPHEMGGEPYVAQEGDIIFPGKKRLAVNQALRTRDWRRIESMRQALPEDRHSGEYPDGTKGVKKSKYPTVHLPKDEDPLRQEELQIAYANQLNLSSEQLDGFRAQRESDRKYYDDKQAYIEQYTKDWRAGKTGNSPNFKFSQTSPEYRAMAKAREDSWYADNKREINPVVQSYYEQGPMGKQSGPIQFNPLMKVPGDINNLDADQMNTRLASADTYREGTKSVKTTPDTDTDPVKRSLRYLKAIKRHNIEGLEKGTRTKTDSLVIHRTAGKNDFNPKDTRITEDHLAAQFFIDKNGQIHQLGDPESKIWHAGDHNDNSIGIEIVGQHLGKDDKDPTWTPMTAAQQEALKQLSGYLVQKYNIPVNNIKAHSEIAAKTAGEGVAGAELVKSYIRSAEYKATPFPTQLNTQDDLVLSEDPEVRVKQEAMMQTNREKLGYTPYEDYVLQEQTEGREPESAEWYEQNVIEPQLEKERGYWTIDSPTGRENYEGRGLNRRNIKLEPRALTNEEKAIYESESKILYPNNDIAARMHAAGETEFLENFYRLGNKNASDEEIRKMVSNSIEGDDHAGLLDDVIYAGVALPQRITRTVAENLQESFHNITDPKLKKEALAFEQFLYDEAANGTWLGRKGTQVLNYIDQGVAATIGGYEDMDDAAFVSNNIWNAIAGESPETVEKLINKAKEEGILSDKGANYAWHVASDPEVFKLQESEAVEDINVISALWSAPRALPRALRGAKNLLKGTKSIFKGGAMNLKNVRNIIKSRDFRMKVKAAKADPNGTAARELAGALSNVVKQRITPDMDLKAIQELVDAVDTPLPKVKLFDWKNVKAFWDTTGRTLRKLPSKISEKFIGASYDDVVAAEKELAELMGTDIRGIRQMDDVAFARNLTQGRKAKVKALNDAIANKEAAWKQYADVKKQVTAAKDRLSKMSDAAKKANPDDLATLNSEINALETELASTVDLMEEANAVTKQQWEQIAKIEKWQGSEGIADDFRMAMKGEKAIAKHLDNLGELEPRVAELKQWQGMLTDEVAKTASSADEIIEALYAKNVVKSGDEALAAGRSANLAQGRATQDLSRFTENAEKSVKLRGAINKYDDLAKEFRQSGKFTAEMYNILRKKGEPIDRILEEIDPEFTPEDIIEQDSARPDAGPAVSEIEAQGIVEAPVQGEVTIPQIGQDVVPEKTGKGKEVLGAIGAGLEGLAKYAPAIYNISRGLQKPEKVMRRFITPQTLKYEDTSDPQRNLIDTAFNAAISNARNLSGGLASNYRANIEAAWAERIARRNQVDAQEVDRSMQIANQNIGIRNRAEEYNAQVNQRADVMDMQSKAATNQFLAQGMQDVANISAMSRRDKNMEKNQSLMLELLNSGRDFSYNNGSITFNPQTPSTATPPIVGPTTIELFPEDE